MARVARDRRIPVAWAIIAIAFALLAAVAFNAFAVESDGSSTSAAASSSSASSAQAGSPATASSSTAAASTSASSSSSSSSSSATASATRDGGSGASSSSSSSSASAASGSPSSTAREPLTWQDSASRQVQAARSRQVVSYGLVGSLPDGEALDTGGSVFTFTSPLEDAAISGDLYWLGNTLELSTDRIGNDILAAAFQLTLSHSRAEGDARVAGQTVQVSDMVLAGNVDVLGFDVSIDEDSAANSFYCGGGSISFSGAANRFVAYGQTIYFDGIVDGDVTLSAQEIIIGPNAQVTGLLDIRSGQNLETLAIPAEARIASISTDLDDPNTIDQIAQIRSAIAPYFQVGSILFIVVAAVLLGLAAFWVFGNKLAEANRLVRRYPLAVLVLGVIMLMFLVVIMMLGPVLIFTIPLSIVVALLLLISLICCIPFTGASLALWWLDGRMRPSIGVAIGAGVGGALLFVPTVNVVVVIASLVYFIGYMVNITLFGHDRVHDASFYKRESDADAPSGKASGILPASGEPEPSEDVPEASGESAVTAAAAGGEGSASAQVDRA